ncbi:APC family permease [Nonomuraea deserti]|uniref:APC family permease n=1 Tax=Nonomuraea deserti TaxID=1848322 RepID=A0A4R4V098_9ACTN|nr:APC family permease [Nonomuraea deserti]TDC98041.1 APC family permease [Nonomuraea deserti]
MTTRRNPSGDAATLAPNRIGFWASVGIGVASTTPSTGIALVFGLLVGSVGVHLPAIVLVGFLPIAAVTFAYLHFNRLDPDCGANFAWTTRAFGPHLGWLAGWLVIVSLAVVVANYAQLLGAYTFVLVGAHDLAASTSAVTIAGATWMLLLGLVAYRGITLSEHVQISMVVFEVIVLIGFGVAAMVRAVSSRPQGWLAPSLDWFNPISIGSASALAAGLAGAALLYWGWDATVMLSEESEHRAENPGRAAVLTTIVLVLFYLIGAVGVLAWAGPGRIAANPDDLLGLLGPEVLGNELNRLLVLAVLTSCIAGGLFLPIGGARVMLSMARRGALPAALATVHHRYRTPSVATVVFTLVSLAFYLVMTIVSDTLLVDTITSVGPLVAGYYGLTGLAGAYYFRSALRDGVGPALSKVVIPLLGSVALGWVAVKNATDLAAPAASSGGTIWFGLGAPFVLTLVMLALGAVGAVVAGFVSPRFVRDPGPGDTR